MTGPQQETLGMLARQDTAQPTWVVAACVGRDVRAVGKTLHALFRRSLVTIDGRGRWLVTDRGRRKAAA
ncbi:MAG: hypothetical protein IT374_08980 [Polyangiaceae bacterium]|nr:hypothetical protein [Polyangiaceae bacterium]